MLSILLSWWVKLFYVCYYASKRKNNPKKYSIVISYFIAREDRPFPLLVADDVTPLVEK